MILINPIYDTAFKYLMEDNKAAKVLLSALLKREVVTLTLRHNELASLDKENNIRMTRLDFSAKIIDANGAEELVSIEIQKAHVAAEVMRFRNYLGQQYSDSTNVQDDGNPLHIIVIYLLGHTIPEFDEPIIYAGPSYRDSDDNAIAPNKPCNEEEKKAMQFVRGLTHDVIIVQIPLLEERPRNYVEEIMSVFDQRYKLSSDTYCIDFAGNEKDEGLQTIVTRLYYGASDRKLRRTIDLEKDYYEDMKELQQAREEANEARRETDAAKKEANEAKKEADEAKQKVDEAKKKVDEAEQKTNEAKQKANEEKQRTVLAIKALAQSGMPVSTIAQTLGLTEKEVNEALEQ